MTSIILTKENRAERTKYASHVITEKLEGGKVELTIRRPSRSRDQEKLYHKLFSIVLDQGYMKIGLPPTFEVYRVKCSDLIPRVGREDALEIVKSYMVNGFYDACIKMGEPLEVKEVQFFSPKIGKYCTSRPSTTRLSVPESSNFIEFIYAEGIEMEVKWPASKQEMMMMGEQNG